MSTRNQISKLVGDVKKRYMEKIELCDGLDPFDLDVQSLSISTQDLPLIHFFDIQMYLLNKDSAYTHQSLRAFKSLEAFKFFESGRVIDLHIKTINDKVIVIGMVKHSQQMNDPPLDAWVLCAKEGEVLCAHCTCIAGLGEVCSHVGAILFAVEFINRNEDFKTCTEVLSKWGVPKGKVAMARIEDIKFHENTSISTNTASSSRNFTPLSVEERFSLIKIIEEQGSGCVLGAFEPEFQQKYVSSDDAALSFENDVIAKKLHLVKFFDPKFEKLELLQLRNMKISISCSKEDIIHIEEITRTQSANICWFRLRAGRITASNFRACCKTSIEKSSISLIKRICFPENCNFNTEATKYGCKHEDKAVAAFFNEMKKTHTNFKISKSGLQLSEDYLFFGASPDAIAECDCCGKSCVEVKCPHCLYKGASIESLVKFRIKFLEKAGDSYKLVENHAYYYQTQMQMFICKLKICHFVVWSETEMVHIPIVADSEFWNRESSIALNFHRNVIVPEILGCYYTKCK